MSRWIGRDEKRQTRLCHFVRCCRAENRPASKITFREFRPLAARTSDSIHASLRSSIRSLFRIYFRVVLFYLYFFQPLGYTFRHASRVAHRVYESDVRQSDARLTIATKVRGKISVYVLPDPEAEVPRSAYLRNRRAEEHNILRVVNIHCLVTINGKSGGRAMYE